jgi:FkbM family methyltransferase
MLKKLIKRSFKRYGYQIKKIQASRQELPKEDVIINLYGCSLKVNAGNPLATWYTTHPRYNSELARAAKLVAEKYTHPGVIDIGANIGDTMTIIRSQLNTKFLCVEGDTLVFKYLEENTKQYSNVKNVNVFLSDSSNTISVVSEKDGWNTTIIPSENDDSRKIQTFKLDDLLADLHQAEDYKFMKVDTEGFDTKILRGGLNFLKKVKPVLFIEYNRDNMDAIGEDGLSTLNILKEIGYNKVLVYESNGRFILPVSLHDTSILQHLHNYIDGKNSTIYYFDLCLFHETDDDIADKFIESENQHRVMSHA